MEKLTADMLMMIAGFAISLLAYWLPFFRKFMDSLGEYKATFMAGFLLVVAAAYTYLWCQYDFACFKSELLSMVFVWLSALGANQTAYLKIVKPAKERAEKKKENPEVK